MAQLDPVKLGSFIDDPSADDANVAFARINANEKLLNEEVRPIATGGTGNTMGLAASATKLATARTLSWTGDVTGSTTFDGTGNKATALTLAASGVTAGTFKSVTVNAKGLVTAGNDVVTGLVTATTAAGTANAATTNSNTFLNVTEKVGTATASAGTSTQITGAGTVTVASDTAGKITITGAAPSVFTTDEAGLVPARIGAVATKYLREDGTWVTPTNTTYTNMSAAEITAGTATTGRLITPKDLKTAVGTYPSSNITGIAAITNGGTGASTAAGAKQSLGLHHFTQDEGATSVYAPEGDSRVVVTKTGWGVWSSDPTFDPALPLTSGGTGGGTLQEAQDNLGITSKVEKGASFRDAFGGPLDYYLDDAAPDQPPNTFTSCADFPVGSRVLVALSKGYSDTPNLDGAYTYIETKATYNFPGRLQIAHGYLNGKMAVRASGSGNSPYGEWRVLFSSADIIPVGNGGTGATTKEQARAALSTAAGSLLLGPDFNTLRESGLFFVKPEGGSNFPAVNWGYLTVISGTDGVLSTLQKYTPDTDPHISYVRQAIGPTWGSWNVFRSMPSNAGVGSPSDLRGIGTPNPSALLGQGLRFGLMSQAQIGAYNSPWYAGLILNAHNDLSAAGANPYILGVGSGQVFLKTPTDSGNAWLRTTTMLSDYNTVRDGNGFIKGASPVVDLYADRIEANDQAKWQNVSFEKLGIGDYLIKGSLGFAQTSWYVEQPKDANGNVFHAVVYDTLDNGDLSIKTYERKLEGVNIVADLTKPVDIKENRFISIRLHEEQEDTTAPINPAITDNEGNAAPTKYHTLEEGIWIISEEDSVKLEQERLAAMQPLKRRQFRLALAMNGFDLKEVEALIETIEDPMKRTIAQIEWQDATDFERTNPSLIMMAELMQLTTAQVDQLWSYGLSL